jgi:hypothetical protein
MVSVSPTPKLPLTLVVLCFVVYGAGIYLTRLYLCQPLGAWVLLVGVGLGALGASLIAGSAIRRRSWSLAIGALSIALLIIFLYFFIGVLTLPGCSGV